MSKGSTKTYNNIGALLEVRDDSNHAWWQCDADDYDEQGRLIRFEYGNGLVTTNHFNSLTGRMEGAGILNGVLGMAEYGYQYDRLGNLTQRSLERGMTTLSESCTYDVLNRLLSSSISGSTNYSISATYNAIGNITSRGGVGSYTYSSARPHAVSSAGGCDYIYDSNGNIVRRDRNSQYEFTAVWNSFNKPTSIFAGMDGSEFEYDVNGRRTRQLIFEGTNVTKKIYVAETYEMEERLLNPAETNRLLWVWEPVHSRIYVNTPSGRVGIYEQAALTNGVGPATRNYIHKDHLGSVVAVSDDSKNVTHYSFDAWGSRRDASDWSPLSSFEHSILATDRGFTGHEQLDHLDLVHMNGRIYDPVIGRMISPDPLIQAPENLQSFNRYSYVFNNPLTHTDPSGFETKKKAANSSAATASTQLAESVSSTEISSQDNVGGEDGSESSAQVDDYYTDGSGYTQVDSTSNPTTTVTKPGDEKIGSSANSNDKNGYGDQSGTSSQHTGESNATPANPTLAAAAGETATEHPESVNGAATATAEYVLPEIKKTTYYVGINGSFVLLGGGTLGLGVYVDNNWAGLYIKGGMASGKMAGASVEAGVSDSFEGASINGEVSTPIGGVSASKEMVDSNTPGDGRGISFNSPGEVGAAVTYTQTGTVPIIPTDPVGQATEALTNDILESGYDSSSRESVYDYFSSGFGGY